MFNTAGKGRQPEALCLALMVVALAVITSASMAADSLNEANEGGKLGTASLATMFLVAIMLKTLICSMSTGVLPVWET